MSEATPDVTLRFMTSVDVPAVLATQEPGAVRGLANVFPQDEFPFPRETLAKRWREIEGQEIDCLLDEKDGALIGVVTGNERGRRFYERQVWARTGERSHSGLPPYAELLQYERDLTFGPTAEAVDPHTRETEVG